MLLQKLHTEPHKEVYRPITYEELTKNLKRRDVWNCVEVHVIYALIYNLGMSQEGVKELKKFVAAEDLKVFEPLFLAQYVMCPVNTIINESLVPWIMHQNQTKSPKKLKQSSPKKQGPSEKDKARQTMAKVFFRYQL